MSHEPSVDAAREAQRHTFGYWLRENVRQIVGAIVIVLLVRYYVVEIFKIPTGSMAETLYGTHVRVDCPRCGWSYVVGAPQGEAAALRGQRARCASCGLENRLKDFADHGGHKIIANKWIYLFKDPARWEVVVFRFFDERARPLNYIKRLVGLPGERIEIRHGDLQVNGAIAAKPWKVQEAVWIPVYDSRMENPHRAAWTHNPAWTAEKGVWRREAASIGTARMTFARPIESDLVYNNGSSRYGPHPVGDLRLAFSATASQGGAVEGTIREDGDTFTFRLSTAEEGIVWHLRDGKEIARWPVARRLADGRETAVSFENADDRIRLSVGGAELLMQTVEGTPPGARAASGIEIGGEGTLILNHLRIDRDLYYIPDPLAAFDIPEGEYFFLGDNSTNSNDSRGWNSPDLQQVHTVLRERILGRASYALLYLEFDWPWKIPWKRISLKEVR